MTAAYFANNLLPAAAEMFGENWMLMHDGSSVHRSNATQKWLADHQIECLDWPAKSPDLNVIENVWGMMVRHIYKNGTQCDDVGSLTNAIIDGWEKIGEDYLKNIYKSIPRRLISVVEEKVR